MPDDTAPFRFPLDPPPLPEDAGFETLCQHFGEHPLGQGGGAAPPIYQNSTFVFPSAEAFNRRKEPGNRFFDYSRIGNPTSNLLAAKVAALEHARWGRTFGSGMGAISAAINACVRQGDHIVCVNRCYWPTKQYLGYMERFGVSTTFVPGVEPDDFAAAFRSNTRVLYLESPTAGLGDVPPVAPLVELAHERGARVIFDNSWATPYFFQPLDLGCDLVLHSATKYIGGHSDVVAGLLFGRDAELEAVVQQECELHGATLDPFAAWLLIRGLRTLPLRMERHQQNALRVAVFLVSHPRIAAVYHPGIPAHPHHETARQQLRGFSSLFSFTLKDQTQEACYRFVDQLRLFGIGASWGGHESLALAGSFFSDDMANPVWIIRLHIGLETVTDLIADIKQALEA